MLLLQIKEDLGAMAMKEYTTFLKASALVESYHKIVSSHIQDTRWRREVLPFFRDEVGVFNEDH